MYVIKNLESGKYVARFPNPHTYTKEVTLARTFSTQRSAEASGVCENERIVAVHDLFYPPEA
jgi:hypothetical protein